MNSKIEQKYVNFSEARSFARSLGLKSRTKWEDWVASNLLPLGIPKRPNIVYAKIGWNGWGDFLGTGFVATHKRKYMPFQKALEYVHNLKISGKDNWAKWAKSDDRPSNIPADPSRVYKNHWITWGHWLGTNSTSPKNRTFRSFKEARLFARSLNLKGQLEWRKWAKTDTRPHDIPAAPDRTYKKEWKNWSDFLGFKRCHKYRSFEDSKNHLSSLALKGRREFLKARRELHLSDIPSTPNKVYADKWQGWDDFLGNAIRLFESARDYVRLLGFKNQKQWKLWAESPQRPHDIPKYPHIAYANKGWIDTADFLGYNKFSSSSEVMSLPEAKKFASGLNLKNKTEWVKWAKTDARPKNLPASPSVYYAGKGWVDWGDFLGTEFIAPQNRSFRSFNEAKIYARSLGISSETEWNAWAKTNKRPVDIPASPRKTYQDDGWNGFGDFLGTGFIAPQNRSYRSFNEARNFAQSLNFKTGDEWFDWAKTEAKPADIPANPAGVYKENWQGWADFLGFVSKWTIPNIRLFVKSILPHLNSLSPAGLYVMFQQTGILDIDHNSRGRSFVQALKTGRFPKEELEKFVAGERSLVNEFFDDSEIPKLLPF